VDPGNGGPETASLPATKDGARSTMMSMAALFLIFMMH